MLIDNGSILVLIATDPDRPTYAEFYRVDAVLALQHAAGPLPDHPGLALLDADGVGDSAWFLDDLRPEQVRAMSRWVAMGRMIAFRWQQGGVVEMPMLASGRPRRALSVSVPVKPKARIEFRDPKRYLDDEQIFWLRQYAEMSFLWEREQEAAKIAICGDSAASDEAEATNGAQLRRATKKGRKLTAKMRRRGAEKNYV